jgi:hypothetical protein
MYLRASRSTPASSAISRMPPQQTRLPVLFADSPKILRVEYAGGSAGTGRCPAAGTRMAKIQQIQSTAKANGLCAP